MIVVLMLVGRWIVMVMKCAMSTVVWHSSLWVIPENRQVEWCLRMTLVSLIAFSSRYTVGWQISTRERIAACEQSSPRKDLRRDMVVMEAQ